VVIMVSTSCQQLNQVMRHAPPDDTPENAKYIHLVVLWLRVKDRTAELQRQLDRLQADIAADVARGSPQALVAASARADRLAVDAVDVAQLIVFADHLYQRLMAFVT
jgi:hypothetical protein